MNDRPNLRELLHAAQSATESVTSPHVVNQTEEQMRVDYNMPPAPAEKAAAPRKPARSKPQAAAAPAGKAWTRGEGKSSNPDYGRMTVYVPKKLRTRAERKWEDDTGKDASDLIEHLLTEYLNA